MTQTADGVQEWVADFDPLSPEFIADPHKALHEMRAKCPVAHSEQFGGFWALTRRRDVIEAAKRNEDFISSVLHIIPGGLAGHTRPLMHSDQPEHTWFREAMLPVFNGPHGAEILPMIRREAERIVAELVATAAAGAGAGVDLVRDYCGPLMAFTLHTFFGMTGVDPADLNRWISQYVHAGQKRDAETVKVAHENMLRVATQLVEDRRANPRDPTRDLVTALVRATKPNGQPLDPQKVIGAVRQPFIIVWLATSHSLANMLERLLTDQALQTTLRERPELVAESIEEFLRLDMPQIGFGRTAARDLEFDGVQMKQRDPVALVFPAANRDPEVFENPDEFVIGRSPNPHLTFGAGVHACPGKNIARSVILAALESLVLGTGGLRLAGDVEREHWPFRAPRTLPTDFTPVAVGEQE